MSVTISAVPFFLVFSVIQSMTEYSNSNKVESKFFKQYMDGRLKEKNPTMHEEDVNLICKEYETVYMDKELLLKTLEEHGVKDIHSLTEEITGKIEDFSFKFYKKEEDKPYIMEVHHKSQSPVEETIFNLDSEYGQNVQEATYLKIKERLAKKNLQIDNEEILEDDSIMLTVNLD